MKRYFLVLTIFLLYAAGNAWSQTSSAQFGINELLKLRRVGDPQISPDGQTIAYTITDVDINANKSKTQIYLIPSSGGESHQLTSGDSSSSSPRWSPDGRKIAFISSRDATGPQIWTITIGGTIEGTVAGSEIKKVSDIALGGGDPVWSPDGKLIAFVSDVYPECKDNDCNKRLSDKVAESKVKVKTADRLLYRHWTAWKEGRRTHVFVVSVDGGEALDLTPGDYDAPPFSLGGPVDYAFSPDSKELAFARNTDQVEATSTNADIFVVSVTGGEARRITGDNKGGDLSPQYSPDGKFIAYRSQVRAGFESDRWRLMLFDRRTSQVRELTKGFDQMANEFAFSPDSKTIFFLADEGQQAQIFSLTTSGNNGGEIKKIIATGSNGDLKISADGKTLFFSRSSLARPTEIYRASVASTVGRDVQAVSKTNDAFLSQFKFREGEEIDWTGAAGATVHGLIVKPANFSENRKWPLLVLIHGGPQGQWSNSWGYRWNAQVFANAGYVVFMPNPRGSTGYGQKFVDEISADWGGKVYTDIMNGVAKVAALPFIDRERIGGAGGSYGGYMIDWIEGHNEDSRFRFKALHSHAGVYNLTSMYGATEELWFTNWEFKGTPWSNPEMYERWSPHMFVKNFKTPMLITHGELDYRVPVGEGLQLFTALQLQDVKSRLVYFPDEGHWISKPQNSVVWYTTALDWFKEFLRPEI
ncbi:MAG: prolyl oligopeptidase family serine peptidase [Pyrinomonadaceae bacterium]